ncbi:Storkhead-box protein 2 [Cricetulus griseus]|uniref:Storkhead-box protein 2 n=1 Tax=Cricetulus griseus TaxID=10029 RepID=G3GSU5_CRIGR|nr:Storkhead-box protein 2 [Cricetulus griseus]
MKKTRSTTLRRAWPSSDFSDRASDRMRSRSEKDYRLHKRFPAAFAPQASRGYMTSGWLMLCVSKTNHEDLVGLFSVQQSTV